MKKIYITGFLFILAFCANAQQEIHHTFFMYNQQSINPAYVGSKSYGSILGTYRNQWTGFEGAPKSQFIGYHTPIFNERVGFGLQISHFEMGITQNWNASMAYSYKLQFSKEWGMRLGLQGVFKYMGINFQDENVVVSVIDDPSIDAGQETKHYRANVGLGMYLTKGEQFYVGVSVPQLYPNDIGINPTSTIAAAYRPHFYFATGGKIVYNETVALNPNLLVKYVENVPVNIDMNINMVFHEQFVAGLTYRFDTAGTNESIDLLMLYQLNPQFGLGLAYDLTLSEIKEYSSGSYEILLRYDLRSEKSDLENPRYF